MSEVPEQLSPLERGKAAIAAILAAPPYAEGTREHVGFVKGMVLEAGNALARCKPAPSAPARPFGTVRRRM